jgi:putative ABC transport system permease protein
VLKKKVGDTVQIEADELPIVGIVDGGAVVENGAIILSLSLLQTVTSNEGKVNFIDIRVTHDSTKEQVAQLCADVKKIFPAGRAMVASEVVGTSQGYQIARAMSWSTSLLAIIVGVLGVMNTMMMTIFERTQEIGILLALGWKRTRIVSMVLWESAMLGLLGGLVGEGLGLLALKVLEQTRTVRGMLEPDVSPQLLLTSLGIAVFVGVISGLYPSWRSSRLSPSLAIHG